MNVELKNISKELKSLHEIKNVVKELNKINDKLALINTNLSGIDRDIKRLNDERDEILESDGDK